MANKNTRLVYTDEMNINIYKSLPDKDFKEFMMAYLTYKKGDDIDSMFTNPIVASLFRVFSQKIEYNEDKWEKRAKASKENGKKGGRPKKTDITENTEFENELSDKSTPIQTEGDNKKEQDRRTVKPSDCRKSPTDDEVRKWADEQYNNKEVS